MTPSGYPLINGLTEYRPIWGDIPIMGIIGVIKVPIMVPIMVHIPLNNPFITPLWLHKRYFPDLPINDSALSGVIMGLIRYP